MRLAFERRELRRRAPPGASDRPAAARAARAPHLGPPARNHRHRRRVPALGPLQDRAQRGRHGIAGTLPCAKQRLRPGAGADLRCPPARALPLARHARRRRLAVRGRRAGQSAAGVAGLRARGAACGRAGLRAPQGRRGGARRPGLHAALGQCARSACTGAAQLRGRLGRIDRHRVRRRGAAAIGPSRDGRDGAAALLHGLEPWRGGRRHLLPPGGARQSRAGRRRQGRGARCRPRPLRPRRHRLAFRTGGRAAARAAPCAFHPHLERHRRLPARPPAGARPEPHHARPVPWLRLFGRGLPDRPRCRRSAGRTRARRPQQHAHRELLDRTLHPTPP